MAQLNGQGRDDYTSVGADVKTGKPGIFHVKSIDPSLGGVLALDGVDSSGNVTTVFIWVSTSGKLRIGTTLPTDTESGTVVGSQS